MLFAGAVFDHLSLTDEHKTARLRPHDVVQLNRKHGVCDLAGPSMHARILVYLLALLHAAAWSLDLVVVTLFVVVKRALRGQLVGELGRRRVEGERIAPRRQVVARVHERLRQVVGLGLLAGVDCGTNAIDALRQAIAVDEDGVADGVEQSKHG